MSGNSDADGNEVHGDEEFSGDEAVVVHPRWRSWRPAARREAGDPLVEDELLIEEGDVDSSSTMSVERTRLALLEWLSLMKTHLKESWILTLNISFQYLQLSLQL